MNIGFTKKAQNALNRALYLASEMGHNSVGCEWLLTRHYFKWTLIRGPTLLQVI